MKSSESPLNLPSLVQAINSQPIIVSSNTLVTEIIPCIGHSYNCQDGNCYNILTANQVIDPEIRMPNTQDSCVLVMESSQVVGIFTSRDLVKAVASGNICQNNLKIGELMRQPVITLKLPEAQDIFTPLLFFRQHQIRHLPILDHNDQLLGIVTPGSILQALKPSNLLRLGTVGEVMNSYLLSANRSVSVLNVAKLMAEAQVSCVVITEGEEKEVRKNENPLAIASIPVGIITEQKILQALVLGIDLAQTPVGNVMRRLGNELNPANSLLYAYQQMQSDRMDTLLVSERNTGKLGIITEMELLRSLEPVHIYQRFKRAHQSVRQLQLEKTELLRSRNAELEKQVQQRTSELQAVLSQVEQQAKQADLVNHIVQAMRGSLVLDEILQTTVNQLHEALKVSRCLIFRPDSQNRLVIHHISEATKEGESLLGIQCDFYNHYHSQLAKGSALVLPRIDKSLGSDIEKLAQECSIRSIAIMPLMYKQSYIGSISLHECDREREWTDDEMVFLKAIADHCAIAIHQAELYQQVQNELIERQKAEQALRMSEQLFRQLAENIHQAFFVRDPQQDKILYLSPAYAEICGLKSEVFYEQPRAFLNIIHPEDRQRINNCVAAELNGTIFNEEYRIIRPDGEIRWVCTSAFPLRNDQGEVYRITGIIEDITERKQAELAMKEQQQFLRTVIDTNPNLIFVKDRDGKFTLVNQACADICNTTPEEMIGKTDAELNLVRAETERFQSGDLEVMATLQTKFIPQESITTARGETRWLQTIKKPIFSPDGKFCQVLGVATDITERVQAEQKLEESEARFRALSECSPVGIFMADIEGFSTYTNPRYQAICGFNFTEGLEYGWLNFVYAEEREWVATNFSNYTINRRESFCEYRFLHKDGNIHWVQVRTAPLFLAENQLIGFVGTVEDITESKKAQEQLQSSLQEKEVLLKEVHHRVKNNLQIIYSLIDLQSQQIQDSHTLEMFHASKNRIKSMALIHERLYQSENMARINFTDYINTLANYLQQAYAIDPYQITLKLDLEPILLNVDTAIPCGLIINELVGNAFKHAFPENTKGTILIELKSLNGRINLKVQDNGCSSANLSYSNQNTLGIKLVNILVKQLEGEIEIAQNQGTIFKIQFSELEY